MAEKLTLNSKVKVYAIENQDGRVLAELRLDPENDSTLGKFMDLYDRASVLGAEASEKLKAIGAGKEQLESQDIKEGLKINEETINSLIEETDRMFGAGFTRKIFADHYEIDEDFLPNISLFTEFYEQVMPIIKAVYGDNANHYSVKKGKK